ncbi:MAG: YpdA family putative bacillithiol disulfide reductase [Melioribacteraceae bacterium]
MKQKFDVIIIGAGPIGLACGIEATKKKLKYLILEKGSLVNSVYNFPINMTFFSTSDRLEIGDVPFISHSDKPTRREALEYFRRVKDSWKLKVNTYESVNSIEKEKDYFKLKTKTRTYITSKVIVATGYFDFPNRLNVVGEELPKVFHYYKESHPFAYQKVLVIGSSNSAVDVALETYRRGAEVTMVIRNSSIDSVVKYWVKPDIENRIKEKEIKVFYNSNAKKITQNYVEIETPKKVVKIKNDFVFAMTGYKPDYKFLNSIGIKFDKSKKRIPIHNKKTYESNIKGLYLAGVVCGGMETNKWFIENSRVHAEQIFKHIVK